MFIDDVSSVNLQSVDATAISAVIDSVFEKEIDAFVKLAQDPAAAGVLIREALTQIAEAKNALSLLDPGLHIRKSDALIELIKAEQLDQAALSQIEKGNVAEANHYLIEASTAKARAELFLEGHDPQPGPFPDGLGGFCQSPGSG